MSEWISVKDRLPKMETLVLIQTKEPDRYLARLGGHKDMFWVEHDCGGFNLCDVTHWMPLPDPPEAKP